jgi:hypothetical protein
MPKIPIIAPPAPTIDPAVPVQGGTELVDGFFDELGALHKRWGVYKWFQLAILNGCDGLYWWKEKKRLVVVMAGRVYSFSALDVYPVEISTPGCRLRLNTPVQFDTLGSQLIMVNGSRIVRWIGDDATPMAYLTDDNAPDSANTAAVINGRIVCDEVGFSRALFTNYTGPLDTAEPIFDATQDITPETSADKVTAVHRLGPELIMLGDSSVEFFVDQGTVPYPWARAFFTGDYGCVSPGSIAKFRGTLFWLTQERQVVNCMGHEISDVSAAIRRQLQGLTNPANARGFMLDRWYVLSFPTDNVTWTFDTLTRTWAKWGYWNMDLGDHDRFIGQCATFVPEWNQWIVGGKSDGAIYLAAERFYSDYYNPIRTTYRSAHMDLDTGFRKKSRGLLVKYGREV